MSSVTSSDSISSSLAISATFAVTFSTEEVLNPSKLSMCSEINVFQTVVKVDVLTSSHES